VLVGIDQVYDQNSYPVTAVVYDLYLHRQLDHGDVFQFFTLSLAENVFFLPRCL